MWASPALAEGLLLEGGEPGRNAMLQSILKAVPIPQVPALPLLGAISTVAFGWLLMSDSIQPIAVYLLQLYLAF